MIDYIKGTIVDLTPAELILENNGIGYRILISLQTYQVLENKKEATVYIYHYLREDMELYYGFATKDERELFELLISVSGIGVNSARMMLSSLSAEEIRHAILSEDIARIKSVKGIGLKSAQRMVLELKDKIVKGEGSDSSELFGGRRGSHQSSDHARFHQTGSNKSHSGSSEGKAGCKSGADHKICPADDVETGLLICRNKREELKYRMEKLRIFLKPAQLSQACIF